jgi:serine/threonine protein kinase
MSEDELELFHDLITKSFAYEMEKRPSAYQMLCHPWFSKVFAKPSMEEWQSGD